MNVADDQATAERTIFTRVSGMLDPPYVDRKPVAGTRHPLREAARAPVNPRRGKRHAVVRANRARQPVLAKQPVEDRAHAVAFRREEAVARQEIAGVLVGDRQGVAIDPIASSEVALEVGGPKIIRLRRDRGNHAGMQVVASAPPFLHEPAASQKIPGGADRGPVHGGMPRPEPGHEVGGAPTRMLPTGCADQGRDLVGDAVRAMMRRSAPDPGGRAGPHPRSARAICSRPSD